MYKGACSMEAVEVVEEVEEEVLEEEEEDSLSLSYTVDKWSKRVAVSLPFSVNINTRPVAGHNFFRCLLVTNECPLTPLFNVASCDQ